MIPGTRNPQTGEDRMFAPIGLVWTERCPCRSELNAVIKTPHLDMGTGFLVSPCYVLTDYHVVFGNRNIEPEAGGGLFHDLLDWGQEVACGACQTRQVL